MNLYQNEILNEYYEQIDMEVSEEELFQKDTYIFYSVYEVQTNGGGGSCTCCYCLSRVQFVFFIILVIGIGISCLSNSDCTSDTLGA